MKTQRQTQNVKEQPNLAYTAWNFAYTALWNGTNFSGKEIAQAKKSIDRFFALAADPRKAFISFCQRVSLVKTYLDTKPGSYLPLPSRWFDPLYAHGFAGTRAWLQKIEDRRSSIPQYRVHLKALAEAVLEFSERPNASNYRYWTQYFGDAGQTGLLNLFMNTVANSQYK